MREQVGVQQAFGASGSFFGAETATLLTSTQSVTLSQGFWMVKTGDHAEVKYTPDAGTTTRTAIAVSSFGCVFSDGFNVVIKGDGTVSAVTTYYTQVKALF